MGNDHDTQQTTPRGIIGVVHVPAIPGDPGGSSFTAAHERAVSDCEALLEGGVEWVIIENFGSAPFRKGWPEEPLEPHAVAALSNVVRSCVGLGARVGVNCLRNDARAAVGIAAACAAEFVRINVHVGAYVTDQGVIEGTAWDTLRYREGLGARHVAILADVLVKHARPLAPVGLIDAARDTVLRGKANGVIVTGAETGKNTDPRDLEELLAAGVDVPAYVGSGVTLDTVTDYRAAAGLIVGTWTKRDGDIRQPVDATRVRMLVDEWASR